MFTIDKNIDDLNITERKIIKVFFSMNNHQIATPEMMLEEARSYILFFREGKGRISAYIALHLLLTDRKLYYAHSSNPFPNNELEKVEEEALEFSEGLGAMLDELDFSKLSDEEKDSWIESQEIFNQKPEPEPELKPADVSPKEAAPVQQDVTAAEATEILSSPPPQHAPAQAQSAPQEQAAPQPPQQMPPAPPVAPAPQQPVSGVPCAPQAPVIQQAPPEQYIPQAQHMQQPPPAPPAYAAPSVQQPYQNPVQQPYQAPSQQPPQEQVIRYAPAVIYVPQPQPQAAPQQPYQSPPAPSVAQPPQQQYQAPIPPAEQQPAPVYVAPQPPQAPYPPQAPSYTPPQNAYIPPPQQMPGSERQPDPRNQGWSSQETTQTRGPQTATPDTRKAPRQQPEQKPVVQEPVIKQAKPANRTSVATPAAPALGKGRPGIREQAVNADVVRPQRSPAEKERKAAEGVVSRDREALARLLTSF